MYILAAEMVLVRMTHAAGLPSPDELIRQLENEGVGGPGDGQSIPKMDGNKEASHAGNSNFTNAQTEKTLPSPDQSSGSAGSMQGARSSNGPSLAYSNTAPALGTVAEENAIGEKAPEIQLNRFEELVFLAEDKRDLQLKTCLRRNVSLVKFENGAIDLHIVGNPPARFLPDLAAKLHEWTGRRWTISVSREMGEPTIESIEQAESRERVDNARERPVIAAILEKFPGSRIVDVRVRKEALQGLDADNLDESGAQANLSEPLAAPEEHDNGLDDFFE